MKLSYNWINKYIDLTGISPERLADMMTSAGFEVEGINRVANGTNLIIGKVLSCEDHPESDHLHICQVDIKKAILPIVCGAPNVAKDQKVIVAQVGAVLPEITIKAGNIRGQVSQGMICALSELGVDKKQLSDEQINGIEVLPDFAIVGNENPLALLGLDDVIIDVSLTPNRVDCLAMWSMAQELRAIVDRNVNLPECQGKADMGLPTKLKIVSETVKCQRFIGKIVNQITIKESPKWMKDALNSVGIKSINNVVDISNFVMMETGQPLHFYDLAKIPTKEIIVKDNLKETYTALDGVEYEICAKDIMITTGGKTIGIAGIMGGDDSKIEHQTKGIIIEAAIFDLASIRNTSRRLNLATEASIRFQKGVEPMAPKKAVDRAIQLLIELADAQAIEETVTIGDFSDKPYFIDIEYNFINAFLATRFTKDEIIKVFERLNLQPKVNKEIITVNIPSYRSDLRIPVDLTEEVIRLLGYDSVPSTIPTIYQCFGKLAENEEERYIIKDIMKDLGASEIVNYSLVSQRHIDNSLMPIGKPITLSNPISEDKKYYRVSLIGSMLETIAYNQARYADEWSLFEIGNVYDDDGNQQERLCVALSNHKTINKWKHLIYQHDFYTLKGQIIEVLADLGYDNKRLSFTETSSDDNVVNPYQSALIYLDKTMIGIIGTVHPLQQKLWNVSDCVVAEINLSAIYHSKASKVKFKAIPRYPSVNYDLAFIVDEKIKAIDMIDTIKKSGGKLISDVSVFDVYKGSNLLSDKKSMAFSIIYQSLDKTLTEKDILPIQKAIIEALNNKYHAELR